MESDKYKTEEKKNRAYLVPLIFATVFGLANLKHCEDIVPNLTIDISNGRIATQEERRIKREQDLEDSINKMGMNYNSFMNVAYPEKSGRDLPKEYNDWRVHINISNDWSIRGRQSVSETDFGKSISIIISEQDAERVLERSRK
ncbi:MAG: hypothetical protein AABX59_00705 [Nanoarchaeota archaeon]